MAPKSDDRRNEDRPSVRVSPTSLRLLVKEMGFDRKDAEKALRRAGGSDIEAALNNLK